MNIDYDVPNMLSHLNSTFINSYLSSWGSIYETLTTEATSSTQYIFCEKEKQTRKYTVK